jgi:LPXTG-site transpeptidase (sortase) family protein
MPAIKSPPEVPAWDVDADWWGPSWDVVTPVCDVGSERRRPRAPEVFDEDFPAPAASYVATPDPSWGRILATTVHLWISRRRRGTAFPSDDAAYPAHKATEPDHRVPEPHADEDVASAGAAVPLARAAPAPPGLAPSHSGATALPSVEAAAPASVAVTPASVEVTPASVAVAPASVAVAPASVVAAPASAEVTPASVVAAPASVDRAVPSAAGPRLPGHRRPGVAGWASAAWAAHARLLSAAMLGAGLLAAGAGTAGLVVARTSAPPVRLAARPSPVAVPTGRTVVPVSLSAVPQPTPKPVELTIPAIGVKAPIVNLGLNRNGTLQVPKTTTVAGWYTGSPAPGATGSAVIAGHVDSRTGPGIFFWLKKMRVGERIYVRRADGTLAVFTVTAVRIYAKSGFPTAMVYGPVPDAELRLITCGGTFDYARGSYLSNVVVYARLST